MNTRFLTRSNHSRRLLLARVVVALAVAAAALRGTGAHAQLAPPNGVEATSVPLAAPAGLAYDAAGNLYIASVDQHVVRKVDLKGIITTVAGTGEQGFAGDGGAATSAVLDSPAGVAVDGSGNLFIADTRNQRIREVVAATGVIATIAGTGVRGFSGDGGAAISAAFAGPQALAFDAAGNLYIADTDNHRIRRITGTTITTVAGDGEQTFSGDGGAATSAGLDSPGGLALDAGANLYIGDTHNQRVRVVSAATGIIATFAGTGSKSFSGDAGAATAAALARPRGLAFDAAGKLYIADSDNHRIRAVGAGAISTFAGDGEQGFSGDTGVSSNAALDTPRAAATFGAGTTQSDAFTDAHNSRARAVSSNGVIETVAGLGATVAPTLVLSGANTVVYGTGTLTATFSNQGRTGSGTVTLLEGTATRASATLSGNVATLTLPTLPAGVHSFAASFPGDSADPATASGVFVVTITPAPLLATANAVSVAYGLPIPALSGTLGGGVLSSDAGNVTPVFATTATQGSDAGAYPITVTLTGSAAGNYTVATSGTSGSLTIAAAATTTVLAIDANPAYLGVPVHLTATVSAATAGTSGTPSGAVNFFNGSQQIGFNVPLANGVATLTVSPAVGTQPLSAVYAPSTSPQDWSASTSNTISASILPDPDFQLSTTPSYQTVVPGQSVGYAINVLPLSGSFTGAVGFTVAGLPAGATATFTPASVTPGASSSSTLMTIRTAPVTGLLRLNPAAGAALAVGLLLWPLARRRRYIARLTAALLLCCGSLGALALLSGCGSSNGFFNQPPNNYTLTITATGVNVSGTPIVHTTTVTLNLQ
ncbi:NHL repeat-containing protein [Granulicella rosea]|uniref:NHL repeat-containing protein n=1 Tax=Granulicella rosea TaxID=474952 RepID=A0A239MGL4_9BACT|nr:Ig-like domain repeat protein [Granulicella rosea]SNT41640.1 NHL repeat-containing protein [Granulicella rosea]